MNEIIKELNDFFKNSEINLYKNIKKIKNCYFDNCYFYEFFIKEKNKKIYLKDCCDIYIEKKNIALDFHNKKYLKSFSKIINKKNLFELSFLNKKIIVKLKKNISQNVIKNFIKEEKEKFFIKLRIFCKNFKNRIKKIFNKNKISKNEIENIKKKLNEKLKIFTKKFSSF
ncbi:hypothetical protein ACWNYQ_00485 [Candidatus Vidania fulgoroideorum]